MKKFTSLTAILLCTVCIAYGQWTYTDLSSAKKNMGVTSLGTKAYFAGGYNGTNTLSLVESYDVETGIWANTGNLSISRQGAEGTACGSKLFFGGGVSANNNTVYSTVDIYDTVTGWTTGQLSVARFGIAAVSHGNKVLFAGGCNYNIVCTNVVDIYYISTGTWSTTNLSSARAAMAYTVVGDLAVFAGGFLNGGAVSDQVDIYNFITNTWTTATLSEARVFASAVAVGDKVIIAGGIKNFPDVPSNRIDIFDTSTGIWTTEVLFESRAWISAGAVNGKAFFAGGSNIANGGVPYDFTNIVDVYNGEDSSWSVDVLAQPRVSQGLAVGDYFLVAGGTCASGLLSSVEILYSPYQGHHIHVPANFPTIQEGINAANNYDTVLVADGTYYEQINFLGKKPLTVASEFLMDGDTNHIANTIIDGSQLTNLDSASVVYFVSGEDSTSILCGFTVRNGKGTYTTDNYNARQGGGIWISNAGAKIIYNRITHNTVDDTQPGNGEMTSGGGIGAKYGMGNYWIVIADNTIDSNSCISMYESSGGGIFLSYNTRIIHNIISYNGGMGYQSAQLWGGGIYVAGWPNTIAIIEENTITNNYMQGLINTCSAGVECANVKVIFSDNLVAENTIKPGGSGGAAGFLLYQPRVGSVVSRNIFRENVSNVWIGGGMVVQTNSSMNTVLVENNYFINNVAPQGGAFCMLSNPVLLQNNVFTGNQATGSGGALYLDNNLNLQIEHLAILINNSFYDNDANGAGGAICSIKAKPLIFNSVFWSDSANNGQEISVVINDTAEIAYSNINADYVYGYMYDGGGNINEDPLFEDLELLTISENSPCVNTGIEEYYCHCGDLNECPHYDIIGTYRPHGGYVDMGAYEFDFGTGIKPHAFQPTTDWHSVYPNPFTDQAVLSYELDSKTKVEINLYNSSGEKIQTLLSEQQEAGKQELQFSSGNLPAGIYFYRITTNSKQATGRIILMK